ncbi:MAG: hypothetical protein H7X99_11230 [Saprospiraceae bacterium]|nr:hypothetical protein [Saprospiraceae bacterium]
MEHSQQVQSAIDNGYDFKIGEYFSRGYEIFKKNPGGFLGYTVVFILISIVVSMIPILGFLIGIVVNPALAVGIPYGAHLQEQTGSQEFGNFFKGFNHIAQLVVANILMLLVYFILLLPLIFVLGFSFISALATSDAGSLMDASSQIASSMIWIFLIGLICLYVAVSFRWTNYLIVFHKYDAVEAIKTSWKLTNKRWFLHFAFILLVGLSIILGLVALIVGILFAYPIVMAADYAGYADVTGLEGSGDAIDEIGVTEDLV